MLGHVSRGWRLIHRRKSVRRKDERRFRATPSPPLLDVDRWSQQRRDSCIKVKWPWIVRWPYVITTEHKQKPDAFIGCWVWPPARCLVNRWQTPSPEVKAAPLGLDMFVRSALGSFVILADFDACGYDALPEPACNMFSTEHHGLSRLGLCCLFLCKCGAKVVTCWSCFGLPLLALSPGQVGA